MRVAAIGVLCGLIGCTDGEAPPPDVPPSTPPDVVPADVDVPDIDDEDWPAPGPVHRVEIEISQADWDTIHADPEARIEVPCTMALNGVAYPYSWFEIHGGYARKLPKKSYRVEIDEDEDAIWDLFGDGEEEHRRFVLQAAWIDPTFLRNKLRLDLMRAAGGRSPRIAFAELSVNGAYHGLYTLIERIDKPYLFRQGLSSAAVVYKATNHNANWGAKSDPLKGYEVKLGEGEAPVELELLQKAVSNTSKTFADFEAEVGARVALDDFHRWQMVHTFAMDTDTFTKNYYLHRALGDDHLFRIITWDADATFGGDWDGGELLPTVEKWHGHDKLAPRLYAIDEYKALHLERYQAALAGIFEPDAIIAQIAALAGVLGPWVAKDFAAWERQKVFDDEIARLTAAVQARHATMSQVISKELE